METILRDLKHASRRLRRYPGFTLIAVLSLALGIGANTAIFSLVEALVFRDTGVAQPEEVMELYLSSPEFPYQPFSIADYRDFERATSSVFTASFGSTLTFAPRDLGDRIETLPAEMVTGGYFPTLGLRPAAGRLFGPEDDVTPAGHAITVLSYDYWQREFNGDAAAVGKELRINGRNFLIVGVAPRDYSGNLRGLEPAVYLPTMMINQLQPSGYDQLNERGDHGTFVRARLRPGVSAAQANAVFTAFVADMKQRYPNEWQQSAQIKTVMLPELIVNPLLDKYILLAAGLLTAVVGLVLLIACANLASFLLAQARDRQREIAIRLAIGAERGALVRQLLTESIALALVGGVAAVGLAKALIWLLFNTDLPLPLPVTIDAALNPIVLLFAFGVTIVAGVLFGLVPALQATRADIVSTIKNENTGGPRRRVTLRDSLVVGQVAVSLVLMVTAGLFLRSMAARQQLDPGFGTEPTAVITLGMSSERYTEEASRQLVQRLEERIQEIPGVQAVGITGNVHLNSLNTQNIELNFDGLTPPEGQRAFAVDYTRVDPGFFSAIGVQIMLGRNFDNSIDRPGAPRVVIVNQNFVDKFWPGQDPLGRTFRNDSVIYTVVGVASNAKIRTPGEPPRAFVYAPFSQMHTYFVTLLARTTGSAEELMPKVLSTMRELDRDLIIIDAKTMDRHLAIMLLPARLAAIVFGAFASLALTLALVGVYGVVSYAVARRIREVGIRMSLGAKPGEVVQLLMKHGLALVGIGGAIGLIIALLAAQVLRSVLFGVQPIDPVTFTVGPIALLSIGALATWIPARRASRIDPARVLKAE